MTVFTQALKSHCDHNYHYLPELLLGQLRYNLGSKVLMDEGESTRISYSTISYSFAYQIEIGIVSIPNLSFDGDISNHRIWLSSASMLKPQTAYRNYSDGSYNTSEAMSALVHQRPALSH